MLEAAVRTYNICPRVHLGQHITSIGGWDDKVRNDCNCLDLFGPLKFLVVTNIQRWLRWSPASVDTTSGGWKNLTERDFNPSYVLWFELIKICPNEATKQ